MTERRNNDVGLLVARVLIGAVFLVTAYWKLKEMPELAQFLTDKGLPAPGIVAWVVFGIEAIGGLALVVGLRPRLVAIVMGCYLVLATLVVHNQFGDSYEFMQALKNLAIIGGLVAIYSAPNRRFQLSPDAT